MTGARYLAIERGAFDAEPVDPPAASISPVRLRAGWTLRPDGQVATAPFGEIAAAHDGQPAEEWMRFFLSVWREYGGRI